jgi:tetratricopeptide (TPR) repeat protein
MRHFGTLLTIASIAMTARALSAQSAAKHIALGDSAYAALRAPDALRHYLAALTTDSTDADALWRAARTESELAEYDPDSARAAALRVDAERHARSAVKRAPRNTEAHFTLARALGRTAFTVPTMERLPYATEIHKEAESCLALDPKHAGCLHVRAVWAAEYMRLGTFTRDMANTMSGGTLFASATWEAAERDLRGAIEADPRRALHHLDLARILIDQDKKDSARAELRATLDAPARDYNDAHYRGEATAALAMLDGKVTAPDTAGTRPGVTPP